jgi:serine/threonine protein kinase
VILFQLLTGRLPFEAESPTQVVLMHLSQPPPDPSRVAPDRNIPQPLVELCLKALAKNPNERFQSADDFAAALKSVLAQISRAGKDREDFEHGMHCPSCNALVPLGQKFCGDCGSRISVPPPSHRRHARTRPRGSDRAPQLPLPFTAREDDLDWLDVCRFEVGSWVTTARIVGDHGCRKVSPLASVLAARCRVGRHGRGDRA